MRVTYFTQDNVRHEINDAPFDSSREAVCFVRTVLGAVGPVIVKGAV